VYKRVLVINDAWVSVWVCLVFVGAYLHIRIIVFVVCECGSKYQFKPLFEAKRASWWCVFACVCVRARARAWERESVCVCWRVLCDCTCVFARASYDWVTSQMQKSHVTRMNTHATHISHKRITYMSHGARVEESHTRHTQNKSCDTGESHINIHVSLKTIIPELVWNRLQRTAAHCNALQHTATHCNTLQHTATHCNTLHFTIDTEHHDRTCLE